MAARKACEYIEKNLAVEVKSLGDDALINVARTSMSSKLIGPESEFFAKLVVDAMKQVKSIGDNGEDKYSLKSVKIAKCHGQGSLESKLINGYAIQTMRVSQ